MNWKLITGALVGAILLRIFGFLSNIWLIFGFVILVWFWDFLLRSFASQKKLINWLLGIFLTVTLLSTVGLNIYQKYIEPVTPQTRAALERAIIDKDLQAALKLDPTLLKSRLGTTSALEILQEQIGAQDSLKLAAAIRKEDPEAALEEINNILEGQKQHREKIETAKAKLFLSPPKEPNLISSGSSLIPIFNPGILFLVALAIAGAGLLLRVLFGKKTLGNKIIWLGVIIFIAALAWQKFFPSQIPSQNRFVQQESRLVDTGYKLEGGKKLSITRLNQNTPPPVKVWSKTESGRWGFLDNWAKNPSWPAWCFRNDTTEKIEIYLDLPINTVLSDFGFSKEKI